MNKTDLVAAIAQKEGITKAAAAAQLDAVLDTITFALRKGETVSIGGFGVFSVRCRPAREGRNPATGQMIALKASRTPAFKASKALKLAVTPLS